jgi:hypothetical protein
MIDSETRARLLRIEEAIKRPYEFIKLRYLEFDSQRSAYYPRSILIAKSGIVALREVNDPQCPEQNAEIILIGGFIYRLTGANLEDLA